MSPFLTPDANSVWFTFATPSVPDFAVYSFSGEEEIHRAYQFTIELVHRLPALDLDAMLGQPGVLKILDRGGEERVVHGIISEARQKHTANKVTHYELVVVPRFWFLGLNVQHRIFQFKSVVDIISQILDEHGFGGEDYRFNVFYSYQPREYCVQYGESDFHFISRLCEEEGIYFYFEHSEDGHCLCFCDRERGPKIPGTSALRYVSQSGLASDFAVISNAALAHTVGSNASAFREWNFTKPKLNLEVEAQEPDHEAAPVPTGLELEQYRYPHGYQLRDQGQGYVNLQLLRQLTRRTMLRLDSDTARFIPSFTFSVFGHPRVDVNADWWVTKVSHAGEQPGVLEHEAPTDRGVSYRSQVEAIPDTVRFVPALDHPKPQLAFEQSAIVTGPAGEEIWPDEYGRVKVQFFWDREGVWDENATCWLRASQGWAGTMYGAMAIPRIGQEVLVSFLEGDPDKPLITGRLNAPFDMPPYALPEHKTRTVFRSMTSPGGKQGRGFNELRIEDKKQEEEIYVHAEKDGNVHVKNDWSEHILHDKHRTVDNFSYSHIKGEEHQSVDLDRKKSLASDDHLTVHGDSHFEVMNRWLGDVGNEIHFASGQKVVLEAGADLTLKVGPSFVRFNSSGVTIQGPVINTSGSPGSGSGAAVVLPEDAVMPEISDKPRADIMRRGVTTAKVRPEAQAEVCPVCEECLAAAAEVDAPFAGSCNGADC